MFHPFVNGPLMDEAGDSGGGGGVATDTGAASESTALVTTGDTSLAVTESDDDAGGELIPHEPFRALENGRPSKTTSAALDSIRQSHPQLARQIPRALAVEARLRSQFPGQNPFDAITRMQRTLKSLGGEEGIQRIRESLADMESMDLLYAGGDPRLFDQMTAQPEGKAAFVKLAPHAFSLYEKLAPNAFTKYMAAVILGDIIGQRVDMTLQRIAELTPKELTAADGTKTPNPAVAELQKLDQYLKRLQKFEQLQPEAEAPAKPGQDDLERQKQELAIEKRKLTLQGWRTAADQEKAQIFNRAWAAETKGKKISAVDKEDIQARFWTRLPIALRNVTGFADSLKEFFENDDRDGYLRYLQSQHAQKIPQVLKAEIARRYGAVTKIIEITPAPGMPRTTPVAGFKKVSERPHMNLVNTRLTSPDMWKKGTAILKTGERVQWS